MNQKIIFSDRAEWNSIHHGVVCIALVNGFQVPCCVRSKTLNLRFGEAITPERYVELFEQYRWDLEDELQQSIENDEFNVDGWIII